MKILVKQTAKAGERLGQLEIVNERYDALYVSLGNYTSIKCLRFHTTLGPLLTTLYESVPHLTRDTQACVSGVSTPRQPGQDAREV